MTHVISYSKEQNIAEILINNPPVNALSQAVRQGIKESIALANDDNQIEAIVIRCEGKTFVAGADINEFGKPPLEPHLPDVLEVVESSEKPIIAALHGNALGGGLELALACHTRIASNNTRLGLPEVTLGLIPGAGGTQRLPRLIGVEAALDMVTTGKPILSQQATRNGLIDEITDTDLAKAAIEYAKQYVQKTETHNIKRASKIDITQVDQTIFDQHRAKLAKKARGQTAPIAALESVENAINLSFSEGMQEERKKFLTCKTSPQSRAMRHAFFAERNCSKVAGIDKSITPYEIKKVGIIGAGTMGSGIAMCFASAGYQVALLELNEANLTKGLSYIKNTYDASCTKGRITEQQKSDYIAAIQGTTSYEDFSDVDLVIEAAFENLDVKKSIFSSLDKVCKADAILASNTSYLDINQIAQASNRAANVIGMHFFSPAHIMKLLEIVQTDSSSKRAIATAIHVGKKIKKIACVVKVCYGFVGNRMYSCYGREANALLLEGATPSQVDNAMKDWGMAMGPLSVTDLSGIDIGYKARRERSEPITENHYFRAADLMVENDRLGKKNHAGFYDYEGNKQLDDTVSIELIRQEAENLNIVQRTITDEEIQQRITLALINEGFAILDESIADKASDIDVIWLNGYGFPRWRGGPMIYAQELGLDNVLKGIQQLHASTGASYWQPAQTLIKLVEKGASLFES